MNGWTNEVTWRLAANIDNTEKIYNKVINTTTFKQYQRAVLDCLPIMPDKDLIVSELDLVDWLTLFSDHISQHTT